VSGFFVFATFTLKWKRGAVKNTYFAVPGGGKWDGRPMAYADFRSKPTYFTVFKMMISSKNVNQNMLKIPYFFEKICKNSLSSGGSASRSQLAFGGWGLPRPHPHAILLTPTVLLQNVLSLLSFLVKVFKKKILVKSLFWRTHYTFGNILFWTFEQILSTSKLIFSPIPQLWFSHTLKNFFWEKIG